MLDTGWWLWINDISVQNLPDLEPFLDRGDSTGASLGGSGGGTGVWREQIRRNYQLRYWNFDLLTRIKYMYHLGMITKLWLSTKIFLEILKENGIQCYQFTQYVLINMKTIPYRLDILSPHHEGMDDEYHQLTPVYSGYYCSDPDQMHVPDAI